MPSLRGEEGTAGPGLSSSQHRGPAGGGPSPLPSGSRASGAPAVCLHTWFALVLPQRLEPPCQLAPCHSLVKSSKQHRDARAAPSCRHTSGHLLHPAGSGGLGSPGRGRAEGPQGSGREEKAWAGWRLPGSCSELSCVFQVASVCHGNECYSAPRYHLQALTCALLAAVVLCPSREISQ